MFQDVSFVTCQLQGFVGGSCVFRICGRKESHEARSTWNAGKEMTALFLAANFFFATPARVS